MGQRLRWVLAVIPLLLAAGRLDAFELQPVLSGLSRPIYLTHSRDGSGRLYVVEQAGVIKVLQPGATAPSVFLDIRDRVSVGAERGLLGLTFHPQYATNGRFFVNYRRFPDFVTPNVDSVMVVAEYRRSSDPNVALRDETVLLAIDLPSSNRNGGMIEFGPDGFLYIGTGDGGPGNDPGNRAQSSSDRLGKILRIDVDHGAPYAIPPDNPFATGGGHPEIYALGLHNPFRFSFDRATGQLRVGDVGQIAFEEISVVTNGANLGWRVFEGFHCTGIDPQLCASPGFTPPIAEYAHTGGRCAVTGGYIYRGLAGTLPVGTYVFADFCSGEIFTLSGSSPPFGVVVLLDTGLSIVSFGEDEAGEIYVVNLGGTVHRLRLSPEETRADFITGLYTNVLGRTPSAGELAGWADFLRGNCTAAGVQAVAFGFFDSAEFGARPLTLQGLVTILYRALLEREPDPAGLAAWTDVLRQARLAIAVVGFIPSAEFRALLPDRTNRAAVGALVTRFYVEILGRSPDVAGLTAWVDFVVATGALETAAVGFLVSPEFEARALTFEGYVTILYRAFLGRPPDPAGLAAWQAVLQAVLLNIIETGFLPAAAPNLARLCEA